jgi:hypothetical protein
MLTFKSQLYSLTSLTNHLRLLSQETPSIIISAGLGSSLYSLGADPTENAVPIVIAQKYLNCCLFIRCSENVFTDLLHSNERLLWLCYSGFQASCQNAVFRKQNEIIVMEQSDSDSYVLACIRPISCQNLGRAADNPNVDYFFFFLSLSSRCQNNALS